MKKQIEMQIESLIKELNLEGEITLEMVKEIIWNEQQGTKEFNHLISVFVKRAKRPKHANKIAQIVSEAWNNLPHKSLGGLSPVEKLQQYKKGELS